MSLIGLPQECPSCHKPQKSRNLCSSCARTEPLFPGMDPGHAGRRKATQIGLFGGGPSKREVEHAKYERARDRVNEAEREFSAVTKAYRERRIGDAEYLAARAKRDEAARAYDEARRPFENRKRA